MKTIALLAASGVLAGTAAFASMSDVPRQKGPAPAKLSAAKSIPLALALEGAQAAQAACITKKAPTTVEVVDLNGNIKVLLSADGADTDSFEYARRKAYTVIKKGIPSGAFGKSLGKIADDAVIQGDQSLIQWAGALPLMRGGQLIGALAVSGPTGEVDDELCAHVGVDKIKAKL